MEKKNPFSRPHIMGKRLVILVIVAGIIPLRRKDALLQLKLGEILKDPKMAMMRIFKGPCLLGGLQKFHNLETMKYLK